MSKNCWFCDKKLGLGNSFPFGAAFVCSECRSLYDSLIHAETKENLFLSEQQLISRLSGNPEKTERIRNVAKSRYMNILSEDEKKTAPSDLQTKFAEEEAAIPRSIVKKEQERERVKQEITDEFLMENGHEGYYEYKVLNILDAKRGYVDVEEITNQLNFLGRQGWHLRCAFTNELGKNASAIGIAGVSLGTNSTQDQSILILERFIKFKS